jgi:hypothetical protein
LRELLLTAGICCAITGPGRLYSQLAPNGLESGR